MTQGAIGWKTEMLMRWSGGTSDLSAEKAGGKKRDAKRTGGLDISRSLPRRQVRDNADARDGDGAGDGREDERRARDKARNTVNTDGPGDKAVARLLYGPSECPYRSVLWLLAPLSVSLFSGVSLLSAS